MDYLQYLEKKLLNLLKLNVLNLIINGLPSIHSIQRLKDKFGAVLNLIINGLPSILFFNEIYINCGKHRVLNLIINGLPSILAYLLLYLIHVFCFKPYYKWITFNTVELSKEMARRIFRGFKPYYKWITFNTERFYHLYTNLMQSMF